MKDDKNIKWTKKDLAHQYKEENPDWSWNECWRKAKLIYRELNKLNYKSFSDDKLFFKYNKPFSYFTYKDDEFSDKPFDGE